MAGRNLEGTSFVRCRHHDIWGAGTCIECWEGVDVGEYPQPNWLLVTAVGSGQSQEHPCRCHTDTVSFCGSTHSLLMSIIYRRCFCRPRLSQRCTACKFTNYTVHKWVLSLFTRALVTFGPSYHPSPKKHVTTYLFPLIVRQNKHARAHIWLDTTTPHNANQGVTCFVSN